MADSMRENVFLPFLPSFCKNHSSLIDVKHLLELTEENKLFSIQNPGKLQEVIRYIHTCLNATKQRAEGLLLLDKLVDQCVTEVFTQNALTWLRFMVQIFESHDPAPVQKLACHVCSQVIEVAKDFTSLSRDVAVLIPQILSPLMSATAEWKNEAFLCINSCIVSYPGPSGSLKGKIESLVVEELNSDASAECIRCYALLSVCGGGGSMGIKHTEGWTAQCDRVLTTLHEVVDQLYEGLDNVSQHGHKANNITASLFEEDLPLAYLERCQVLLTRLRTSSACLQALLSQHLAAQIKVPAQDILQLLCKVLCVNCKTLTSRPSTERLQLSAFIPAIHTAMMSVIPSLITSCKQNLLPHSKLIVNLLVQGLAWSSVTPPYGQEKPYSGLRQSLYNCLSLWLQTTSTFIETMTEESVLVREIIHDARPQIDALKMSSVTGVSSKGDGPPPSKKKKRTGYQEISHGISTQRKVDVTAGSKLAASTLKCLYWLVTTSGTRLQHKSLQSVLDFVISTALMVYEKGRNLPIPYTHPECRLQLLRVLQACTLVPHLTVPSPLQCALGIFRLAGQDGDLNVSGFSVEAQRILEIIIHPRAPCLRPPVVCSTVIHIGQADICEMGDNSVNTKISETSSEVNKFHLQQPKSFQTSTQSSHNGQQTSQNGLFTAVPSTSFQSFLSPVERIEDEESPVSYSQKQVTCTQVTKQQSLPNGENSTTISLEDATNTFLQSSSQTSMDTSDSNNDKQNPLTSQENASDTEQPGKVVQESGAEIIKEDYQSLPSSSNSDSQLFSQAGNETISSIDLENLEGENESQKDKVDLDSSEHVTQVTTESCDVTEEGRSQEVEDMLASFTDADPDQ